MIYKKILLDFNGASNKKVSSIFILVHIIECFSVTKDHYRTCTMMLKLIICTLHLSAILCTSVAVASVAEEEQLIAELDPHYYSSTDDFFNIEAELEKSANPRRFYYVQ